MYRQPPPRASVVYGGGWGKGRGSAYGRAISIEKGTYYSMSGKLTSKHLGSYTLDENDQQTAFSQFQFGGTYRRFTPVPWLDDHVISTSISGGGTVGDRTRFGSYRLGGNFGIGGLYTSPRSRPLRGFFLAPSMATGITSAVSSTAALCGSTAVSGPSSLRSLLLAAFWMRGTRSTNSQRKRKNKSQSSSDADGSGVSSGAPQ